MIRAPRARTHNTSDNAPMPQRIAPQTASVATSSRPPRATSPPFSYIFLHKSIYGSIVFASSHKRTPIPATATPPSANCSLGILERPHTMRPITATVPRMTAPPKAAASASSPIGIMNSWMTYALTARINAIPSAARLPASSWSLSILLRLHTIAVIIPTIPRTIRPP